MSTTNKEITYNIDQIKKNAVTGTPAVDTLLNSGKVNLQDYGIDYSQAQRDEIASIFANDATKAYGKAQNDFSNTMATQQATLQDTIRRSQAQAVATGASRGMQAANELSNILGLQEEAAKGATEMQGSYAEALANAQKQAMDMQNARAQTGASILNADMQAAAERYAADAAAEAQKYSVNVDAQMNDPFRAITEILNLRAQGNTTEADALAYAWLGSHGVPDDVIAKLVTSGNATYDESGNVVTTKQNWSAGNNGALSGDFTGSLWNKVNYESLQKNKDEQFVYKFGDKKYTLTAQGTPISSSSDAALFSILGKLSGNPTAATGTMVYYNGHAYVSAYGSWHKIDDKKDEGDKFLKKLKG